MEKYIFEAQLGAYCYVLFEEDTAIVECQQFSNGMIFWIECEDWHNIRLKWYGGDEVFEPTQIGDIAWENEKRIVSWQRCV